MEIDLEGGNIESEYFLLWSGGSRNYQRVVKEVWQLSHCTKRQLTRKIAVSSLFYVVFV